MGRVVAQITDRMYNELGYAYSYGPGLWRYDMALMKNIRIFEALGGQFRAERFNLFNHNNPSNIGTTYSTSPTSAFGRVTDTRDGRTVQLALKLNF